jgi:hypothetical protein
MEKGREKKSVTFSCFKIAFIRTLLADTYTILYSCGKSNLKTFWENCHLDKQLLISYSGNSRQVDKIKMFKNCFWLDYMTHKHVTQGWFRTYGHYFRRWFCRSLWRKNLISARVLSLVVYELLVLYNPHRRPPVNRESQYVTLNCLTGDVNNLDAFHLRCSVCYCHLTHYPARWSLQLKKEYSNSSLKAWEIQATHTVRSMLVVCNMWFWLSACVMFKMLFSIAEYADMIYVQFLWL